MDECEYKLNLEFDDEEELKESYKMISYIKAKFRKVMDNTDLVKVVFDQLKLGSCVANALSNAIIDSGFTPSRLFIYYNGRTSKQSDTGMTIHNALKTTSKYGYISERVWPYVIQKFNEKPSKDLYQIAIEKAGIKFQWIENSKVFIKNEIYNKRLIIFGAKIYDTFIHPKDGMIKTPDKSKDKYLGNHCMLIVGANSYKRSYLILNSWGDKWGDKGYCWMSYEYIHDNDLCRNFFVIV